MPSKTLAQYALMSQDKLQRGVFIGIQTEEELSKKLMFDTMEGNALLYDYEATLPTAGTFALGGTLASTGGTVTQATATLKRVYSQTDVDRYVMQTRSNINDQLTQARLDAAKAMSRKFADLVINGDLTVNDQEFDGLEAFCRDLTRMMAMDDGVIDGPGTAETELTMDRLDAMIDQVRPGRPDCLVMNRTMRRKLTALSRATGSGVLQTSLDKFGVHVVMYDDIPIVIDDWISNAEQYADAATWPSSTATTIFAVKFGKEKQGFTILHNGPVLTPDWRLVGELEDYDENRYRMTVYVTSALWSPLAVAALGGIDSTA